VETQSSSIGLIQFIEVLISLIYILMLSVVLFLTDPSLTLKAIGLASIFFICIYLAMNNFAKRTGLTEVTLNQELNAQISENISLNKEYRMAQTTNIAISRVKKAALQLRNVLVTWDAVSSSVAPIIELFVVIMFCSLILITSVHSPNSLSELISLMAVFAVVGLRMLQRSARVSSSIMAVRKYTASLEVIFPYVRMETNKKKNNYTFPGGNISCQGLTIRDRDGNSVLNKLELYIAERSVTAIVGPSGSGKTSLIETLLGLRTEYDGQVMYNNVNIKDIDTNSILKHISIVSQNIDLFNTSLKENISGKLDLSDNDISELGKSLKLNSFVDKLDNGYDTVVGERGNMLSGGQKQRVLIARALKYDAPYLLLDEPTSALDANLEEHIFGLIKSLKGQKTIIIVTHRRKLLELADSVYEIVDQQLVKRG
jgi:ABC-type bacteriocin/lantibiotic exporter with double-glycine peptidase domain